VAIAHEYGVPFHTDAVQAVGQIPVDFGSSGVDAMTVTGHKFGGPIGAGVLLLGRDVECVPVLHGGGQERDVRSGTLDVPAVRGRATCCWQWGTTRTAHVARCASPWVTPRTHPTSTLLWRQSHRSWIEPGRLRRH